MKIVSIGILLMVGMGIVVMLSIVVKEQDVTKYAIKNHLDLILKNFFIFNIMNQICKNCKHWESANGEYGNCTVKYYNQETVYNHICDEVMIDGDKEFKLEEVLFFKEK